MTISSASDKKLRGNHLRFQVIMAANCGTGTFVKFAVAASGAVFSLICLMEAFMRITAETAVARACLSFKWIPSIFQPDMASPTICIVLTFCSIRRIQELPF